MALWAARFREDDAARRYVERILWPSGPVCPRCRQTETVYKLVSKPESVHGLGTRIYKCARCRHRFSVTSNTIFARSHIALHKWLLASHLICSTKAAVSALQLQHELELGSYRAAWSMSRRIRWALDRAHVPSQGEDAIATLLQVKPVSGMPRPGTRRQKSVWAEVDEELHSAPSPHEKKGRATVKPPSAPRQ
jgi:transposase-like protein